MRPGVPPEPNPSDQPDLADRVKLVAQRGDQDLLSFYGPAQQAFQRLLQALGSMQDVSGVNISCDKIVHLNGIVFDATQAPFRVNGRKWSCAFNLAATPAASNIVDVQNRASAQPPDGMILLTIDEFRYQGPSVCSVRPVIPAGNVNDTAAGAARDLEVINVDNAAISEKVVVAAVGTLATTGGLGTGTAVAFLANVAAGNPPDVYRPEGMVLWPRELVELIQQTVNVVMTLTVSGRAWTFTKKIT
jgi:hypothetical protein